MKKEMIAYLVEWLMNKDKYTNFRPSKRTESNPPHSSKDLMILSRFFQIVDTVEDDS
ncbi:unnamed protein product [Trichogramma brassicae]|uniref:Uncharacterized protein n=1 Tax=Trichogramma brassicae TaxID=86971 RepID=A0A6H5HWP1_9HYME|nr:unnamed protein product [Trichogramma brassicae]